MEMFFFDWRFFDEKNRSTDKYSTTYRKQFSQMACCICLFLMRTVRGLAWLRMRDAEVCPKNITKHIFFVEQNKFLDNKMHFNVLRKICLLWVRTPHRPLFSFFVNFSVRRRRKHYYLKKKNNNNNNSHIYTKRKYNLMFVVWLHQTNVKMQTFLLFSASTESSSLMAFCSFLYSTFAPFFLHSCNIITFFGIFLTMECLLLRHNKIIL